MVETLAAAVSTRSTSTTSFSSFSLESQQQQQEKQEKQKKQQQQEKQKKQPQQILRVVVKTILVNVSHSCSTDDGTIGRLGLMMVPLVDNVLLMTKDTEGTQRGHNGDTTGTQRDGFESGSSAHVLLRFLQCMYNYQYIQYQYINTYQKTTRW